MITTAIPSFLQDLEDHFNEAMISNDIARIGACITEDWLLVTPEPGPIPRSRILEVTARVKVVVASFMLPTVEYRAQPNTPL